MKTEIPIAKQLAARITEYLNAGGLFNPELMDHHKVSDLLLECRDELVESSRSAQKLVAIEEYLWPEQTGLPNKHRDPLLAIQTRERLMKEQVEKLEDELADAKHSYEVVNQRLDAAAKSTPEMAAPFDPMKTMLPKPSPKQTFTDRAIELRDSLKMLANSIRPTDEMAAWHLNVACVEIQKSLPV